MELTDEKFGLPEVWERYSQTRTKQDNCNVCEELFSMMAVFGMGNRNFYCKQCGHAVCQSCSTNKRYLSKDAKEKLRVCDLCDTKLDNVRLQINFEKLIAYKDERLSLSD